MATKNRATKRPAAKPQARKTLRNVGQEQPQVAPEETETEEATEETAPTLPGLDADSRGASVSVGVDDDFELFPDGVETEDEGDGIVKEENEATPDGTEQTLSSHPDSDDEVAPAAERRYSQFLQSGLFTTEFAVPDSGFTDEFHHLCIEKTMKEARAIGLRTRGGAFRSGFRRNNTKAVYSVHVKD